jgi:soluble lytic murein transglycosylase-like protein
VILLAALSLAPLTGVYYVATGGVKLPAWGSPVEPRFDRLPMSALRSIVEQACARHGMEEALILAVVQAESNFDHRAVSHRGARGLMQLMPATARELGVRDAFDPEENIDGGVRYLKWLLRQFDNDTRLALAAYNAGPTNVRRHKGIPPFRETKRYVKRVLGFYEDYTAG